MSIFWSVADHRSSKCSGSHSSNIASQDFLRRQHSSGDSWSWGFAAARPTACRISRGRWVRKPKKASAAEPGRGVEFYRDRFRANPEDADAALQYGKALRAAGQRVPGGRRARTGHDRSPRATRPCLRVMGERWRTMAISSRPSMSSAAPIPPTIPIGGSSRLKALCSISSAEARKPGNTMRAR